MSKTNGVIKTVFVSGLIGAGFWWSLRKSAAKGIKAAVNKINIVGINRILVDLDVFNPSKNTVSVDSVQANVLFNGEPVGNVNYISKIPIKPLATTLLPDIPVVITPNGLIMLATEVIARTSKSGVFTVNGAVYVNGIAFPFNQTKKLW